MPPEGHTSSRSVSHYCGPIASSYQRTKRRNPSIIHLTRDLLCAWGSRYLLLTNKPPRNKMALHNYLLLLLMNLSSDEAQLGGPSFRSHVVVLRLQLGLELPKGSSGQDDQGGSLTSGCPMNSLPSHSVSVSRPSPPGVSFT